MPIGGINVFAFKVNTVDKGTVNIGPLMLVDWSGLSKQNYAAGEANGDANLMAAQLNTVFDQDLVDVPVNKAAAAGGLA